MNAWNPIIEAPQDGTVIEARGRDRGDPQGALHKGFVFYENGNWTDGDTIYWFLTEWREVTK